MTHFKIGIIVVLAIVLCGLMPIALGQNRQTNPVNTSSDPESRISFKYPSNWQVASEAYVQSMFGEGPTIISAIMLFPDSFSGASFTIITEMLPLPISSEIFEEQSKRALSTDPTAILGPSVHVSISNLKAYQYDVEYTDVQSTQTQIVFTKDSKGFTIAHSLGFRDQTKDLDAINLMLNSLEIKERSPSLNDSNKEGTELARHFISGMLDSMLSPIGNSFVDDETGFKIAFPEGWNGTRMNIFVMDGASVSPNGSNMTEEMTKSITEAMNQTFTEINSFRTSGQGQEQEQSPSFTRDKLNKMITNYLPIINVLLIDKEILSLFHVSNSTSFEPSYLVDILYTINDMSTNCSILSVNYTKLNTIPAENSVSECVFDFIPDKIKSMVNVLSTNDKIIFIGYSAKANEFNTYIGQATNSLETIELRNPIDPLTILKE